jgi:hypothetical protein
VTATASAPIATIDDVLAFFNTEPKGARRIRLEGLLQTATDELRDELGGTSFLRSPTTGTKTWTVDGNGKGLLHAHRGVIELSLVEISFDGGLTFTALATTDWTLQWDAYSSDEPPAGEPYFHLRMLSTGTYSAFPRGTKTVRLTGAEGWDSVPYAAIEGVAERARQIAFADPSYEGNVPAEDAYGRPTVSGRWPDVTWKLIKRENHRFYACEA